MNSPYVIKRDRFSSHQIVARYLVSQAKDKQITVLDLGCDIGFVGTLSGSENIRFTGADISSEVLKKLPGVYKSKILLDLNSKDWRIGEKFDYVVFTDVLEHLYDPAAAIRQISQLLKTGGTLILSVPNFAFIAVRLIILLGFYPRHRRGPFDRTHLYHYTRNTIREQITDSGFEIVGEKFTNPPIHLVAPRLFSNPIGNLVYYLIHIPVRVFPELFAYQFVYFCRKK